MWRKIEALGTSISVWTDSDDFFVLIEKEARRIENKFSRFISDSALSKLNKSLNGWQDIDEEFFDLLTQAQSLYHFTDTLFDISVKSILDDWGYDQDYNLGKETQKSASNRTGFFELDKKSRQVKLTAEIDFGAFGKGYFLDQAKKIADDICIKNLFINAGGDLYARGSEIVLDNKRPWMIYFEDPRNAKLVIGEGIIDDVFCASSSPLRRAWRDRHHLVDPKREVPANQMKSVFLQSKKSGLDADAMSTAFFVMGFEKARDFFIKKKPDLSLMLVSPEGQVWKSDNFLGTLYKC